MGVAEHIFDVNIHGKAVTWHLFDVGGARGQRHSWVPYFDDANAIIFVAPVSAFDQVSAFHAISSASNLRTAQYFDVELHLQYGVSILIAFHPLVLTNTLPQYLEEDPRTNRIDDSLQLFTQICSNALLKNVHLVLFLSTPNICDVECWLIQLFYLDKTDLLRSKLDIGLKVRK